MKIRNILSSLGKRRVMLILLCVFFVVYLTIFILQFSKTTTRDLKRDFYTFEGIPAYTGTSPVVLTPNVVSRGNSSVANIGYGGCSMLKASPSNNFKQENYEYFTERFVVDKEPVKTWLDKSHQQSFCQDRVKVYDKRFAVFNHAVLNPFKILNLPRMLKGGEEVRHVLSQGLDKEDYKFSPGFLEMNCSEDQPAITDSYKMMNLVSFNKVESGHEDITEAAKHFETEAKFAVAMIRIDYANLHNWGRELYNVLLILMIHNIQPKDTAVVFLDAHPFSNLDITWESMFGKVIRVGHLTGPVWFKHLVLGFDEADGLVSDFRREKSAYFEECRSVILKHHNLNPQSSLNCSMPTITLLIRRNAVFHPRNIEGKVGRKIFNEAQLIDALMTAIPGACVQGVLMESLPMISQLEIISQTDVMIGMHGAGMTHALFLPQHAAILELFELNFKIGRPHYACYQAIGRWRDLAYDSWENFDASLQMPHDFTIVPVDVIVEKTLKLVDQISKKKKSG